MFQSRPARRNRLLLTAAIMLSLMTVVMIIAFVDQARGDDGKAFLPTPSVPTHDLAVIAAGQATKAALDVQEDAQQEAAIATAIRSDQLGLPNSKDRNVTTAALVPMPVTTMQAQTLPRSSNGVNTIQSASSGWINRYHFSNMWSGTVDNHQVDLYAGSKVNGTSDGDSPEQGIILYSTLGASADMEYLTPTQHGVLTFTDATGGCLTATAADGTRFAFDAANHTWSCTP
ncbi:MAG: hypothetical protein ABJA50_11740 [Chloroflexota bacterium]